MGAAVNRQNTLVNGHPGFTLIRQAPAGREAPCLR